MLSKLIWVGVLLLVTAVSPAQNPPFFEEIQTFKRADQQKMPPQGATLFVGSSSIRLWKSLANDFPDLTVINRGFGGSTLEHLLWYLDDVVLPYEPQQIVIYCGENDIATGTITPEQVLHRVQILMMKIRVAYPQVPVFFVSLKPSISRLQYLERMKTANKLISIYLETQHHATFVDIFQAMLDSQGQPRPDIFIEDNLHMNSQGYAIWRGILLPHLAP